MHVYYYESMYVTNIALILLIISIFVYISFFIYSGIKGSRLYSYLYKNYNKRWKELTSIGKLGPGFMNPFRGFPYIYNNIDIEDEKILKFKISIRKGLRFTLFSFLTVIITSFFLVIFIKLRL